MKTPVIIDSAAWYVLVIYLVHTGYVLFNKGTWNFFCCLSLTKAYSVNPMEFGIYVVLSDLHPLRVQHPTCMFITSTQNGFYSKHSLWIISIFTRHLKYDFVERLVHTWPCMWMFIVNDYFKVTSHTNARTRNICYRYAVSNLFINCLSNKNGPVKVSHFSLQFIVKYSVLQHHAPTYLLPLYCRTVFLKGANAQTETGSNQLCAPISVTQKIILRWEPMYVQKQVYGATYGLMLTYKSQEVWLRIVLFTLAGLFNSSFF